ncbi:UNVERIFIED_CONTAM: hypothetical protein GTU68_050443 [Idotea baltica]|nr:hypothetical protein [Idotea baltica]
MKFAVITLFPELLEAFLAAGVIGRAVQDKKISVALINPRSFTSDRHRTVDDRPFGGGPGMVMKAEPLIAAIDAAKAAIPHAKTVYLSPQGEPLKQPWLRAWGNTDGIILIAGRYEGIDERVIEQYVDAEISIGDFVLSGGEIAAMVVIDSLSRLIPGVLGSELSAEEDSFGEDGLLDHPHYTRPETLGQNAVPAVLKSGDHKAIAEWRRRMAVTRTWERRPDLLASAKLTAADELVLKQLKDASGAKSSEQ